MRCSLPILFLFALLFIGMSSCGYHPVASVQAVDVALVTTRAPHPELASCLTRELRANIGSLGGGRDERPDVRLEAEILSLESAPETLARDGTGVRPIEELSRLVVRARIIELGEGDPVIWGPTAYELEELFLDGGSPLSDLAASSEMRSRLCRELARRISSDAAIELRRDRGQDRRR